MGAFARTLLLSKNGIKATKCSFILVRNSHSELVVIWKDNEQKNHCYRM